MEKIYSLIQIDPHASLPLVHQLAQRLTWMIASGTIREGEKLPNIRDMGDFLGVHMHTVRAAYHLLEDRGVVSIKPRAGTVVLKYVPFITSGDAVQADKSLIAVIVPELNDFYNLIFQGIQSIAAAQHFLPVIIPCGDEPFIAESVFNNVSARDFAGVINISLGFSGEFYEYFTGVKYLNVPLVFVDDFAATSHKIVIDTSSAIKTAVAHLLEHQYQEIALLNVPSDWEQGREILIGFTEALNEANITFSPDFLYSVPNFSHAAGVFCARQIITSGNLPRAIVTASDTLALGVISEFQNQGLHVPDDIAIIGYNDIPSAASSSPPLSTISLPSYDIGIRAMKIILKILNGETKKWEKYTFSGKLVIRKSCGCNNKS